jgi:Predicted transmembrane and coiled-coil 2 protein
MYLANIYIRLMIFLQNEIENLKQAMVDMEEKVQYQSDERLRDVNEVLENCQTRVSNIYLKLHHIITKIIS